jgi:CheY-like chemotaxis protein
VLNHRALLVDFYTMEIEETPIEQNASAPHPGTAQLDILVVDDDRSVVDVVSEIIAASGHRARTAENGREALEVLARQHCDLVISDIRMPEMDGFELARQMRDRYPEINLVLMTGYSSDSTFQEAMRLSVDAYLAKPFKTADLARILNGIQRANAERTAKTKPAGP